MCQSYGHFCQILAFFTMPAHQTWLCPNSTFNIRKSHKISGGKALYFKSYKPKTGGGGEVENTPSAFRVKV